MYQVASSSTFLRAHRRLLSRGVTGPRVSRAVVLLGLTSLFTDISSEMVSTVLPLYLVYTVGLSPLGFGVIDGLYGGAAALVRVAGGFLGDRWQRHKDVAFVGYALSAATRLGLLLVGSPAAIGGMVVADRTGKGVRTAPRDALISLNSRPEDLGTSFGVHRALDTTGAMIGPLLAFALLALSPHGFHSVFLVSFCAALIGLAILGLFVENRPAVAPAPTAAERVSLRDAARLLAEPRFRSLVLVGGALAVATMSDGFLYLGFQRRADFDPRFFPLLFVGTAFAYMVLAVPAGRLADRWGRGRVFLGGYALLLGVYTSLLLPTLGPAAMLPYLLLFGAYYAATDGVLMALASGILPGELRGSGLSLLVTATNIGRLLASIAFGAVWTVWGLHAATLVFAAALAAAIAAAAVVLRKAAHA